MAPGRGPGAVAALALPVSGGSLRQLSSRQPSTAATRCGKHTTVFVIAWESVAALGLPAHDVDRDGLVQGVQQVRTIVTEISVASQEQTQGIAEVATAVSQMDRATQQNAAQVEEVTAAAQALSEEAGMLDTVGSRFRLDAPDDTGVSPVPVLVPVRLHE